MSVNRNLAVFKIHDIRGVLINIDTLSGIDRNYEPIVHTLVALKEQGLKLGLLTCESEGKSFDIVNGERFDKFFDVIYGDTTNQSGDLLSKFCSTYQLESHEVAMISHSIADMEYAKRQNMGCAVFIEGQSINVTAERKADIILNRIEQLIYS